MNRKRVATRAILVLAVLGIVVGGYYYYNAWVLRYVSRPQTAPFSDEEITEIVEPIMRDQLGPSDGSVDRVQHFSVGWSYDSYLAVIVFDCRDAPTPDLRRSLAMEDVFNIMKPLYETDYAMGEIAMIGRCDCDDEGSDSFMATLRRDAANDIDWSNVTADGLWPQLNLELRTDWGSFFECPPAGVPPTSDKLAGDD